jgi:hypothetical protein
MSTRSPLSIANLNAPLERALADRKLAEQLERKVTVRQVGNVVQAAMLPFMESVSSALQSTDLSVLALGRLLIAKGLITEEELVETEEAVRNVFNTALAGEQNPENPDMQRLTEGPETAKSQAPNAPPPTTEDIRRRVETLGGPVTESSETAPRRLVEG